MTDPRPMVDVLADWAEDAQVLRRRGHGRDAELIDSFIQDVRTSDAEGWVTWISEADAILRSGKISSWFRRNRAAWIELGLAKREGRVNYYRLCIIPQRKHLSAVREDARRAAHEAT